MVASTFNSCLSDNLFLTTSVQILYLGACPSAPSIIYFSFNLIEIVVSSYSVTTSTWSCRCSKKCVNIWFQKYEKFLPRLCRITLHVLFCSVVIILAFVPIRYLLTLDKEFNADSKVNLPPRRRRAFFGSSSHTFTKSSKLSLLA